MRKRSGFFRESIPKREIEMIQKTIERKRKLSAEVCWEIVHLRDNRCLSWSQTAEHLQEHFQLSVSIRAIIKGYKKAKKRWQQIQSDNDITRACLARAFDCMSTAGFPMGLHRSELNLATK